MIDAFVRFETKFNLLFFLENKIFVKFQIAFKIFLVFLLIEGDEC